MRFSAMYRLRWYRRAFTCYGLSIGTQIDDLKWPWTATRSNSLRISRHFSCFGGNNS